MRLGRRTGSVLRSPMAGKPATKALPSAPEVVFRKSRRCEAEGEGDSFCIPTLITLLVEREEMPTLM
jgi:hypothetical protein